MAKTDDIAADSGDAERLRVELAAAQAKVRELTAQLQSAQVVQAERFYADDFAIFAKSQRAAERIMASITRFLNCKLRLVVNREKSQVVTSDAFQFLGFAFGGARATIRVSEKSVQRFKRRTREFTGRSHGISLTRRLRELRTLSEEICTI